LLVFYQFPCSLSTCQIHRGEVLGQVYQVEVALARNSITANYQTIKFKAGQTAAADIIIRRRRVADILLEPFRQLQKGGADL
jgi:hypothetical protein